MNSEETALIIESTSTSLFCFVSSLPVLLCDRRGPVEKNMCCFDEAATISCSPQLLLPWPLTQDQGLPRGPPGHTCPRWELSKAES